MKEFNQKDKYFEKMYKKTKLIYTDLIKIDDNTYKVNCILRLK